MPPVWAFSRTSCAAGPAPCLWVWGGSFASTWVLMRGMLWGKRTCSKGLAMQQQVWGMVIDLVFYPFVFLGFSLPCFFSFLIALSVLIPSSGPLSCLPYPAEDRHPEKPSGRVSKEASSTNGWARGKERRSHARRRSRR